jgi:hypothetical protein
VFSGWYTTWNVYITWANPYTPNISNDWQVLIARFKPAVIKYSICESDIRWTVSWNGYQNLWILGTNPTIVNGTNLSYVQQWIDTPTWIGNTVTAVPNAWNTFLYWSDGITTASRTDTTATVVPNTTLCAVFN